MPNTIDASGIQIQNISEIIDEIINGTATVPGLVTIYGPDINVDPNSPDGNLVNIFALSKLDIEQFGVLIYNSFDPDQAVGLKLDGIGAICDCKRQGGTYTEVQIVVNVTGSINLNGLDTSTPYTVSDANSNYFYLIESDTLSNGDNTLLFRAANIGNIQVQVNTINVPITIIGGVNSVNNPSAATQQGVNQETDSGYRVRRSQSTAKPSQGFNGSLYAGLLAIDGLLQGVIYENDGATTDVHGVPGHSIWVIVNGGTDDDVADAIYLWRNAGCGMKGAVNVEVPQADGTEFQVSFDHAVSQNLFVQMTITSLSGGAIDTTALKNSLASEYVLGINQVADITALTALVHSINPDILVQSAGVCATLMGSYVDSIFPSALKNYWTLLSGNIAITVD